MDVCEIDAACRVGPAAVVDRDSDDQGPMVARCSGCDGEAPYPVPRDRNWAHPTACSACGRWYFRCGLGGSAKARLNKRVKRFQEELGLLQRFWRILRNPGNQEDTQVFDRLVGRENEPQPSGRVAPRCAVSLPIVAVPLDETAAATREAFAATIGDISRTGMGAIARADVDAPLLAVDFSQAGQPGLQVIIEIRWRRRDSGWTQFGGRFLHDSAAGLPLV